MNERLNIFSRIGLAFYSFFLALFDRTFALSIRGLRNQRRLALPAAEEPLLEAPAPKVDRSIIEHRDALHLLAILQRDGRLIDFLQEDIAPYSDAEVGAAARTVHEGCRKAVQSYFLLEHVFPEPEGATLSIPAGFDASAVRLTGNVVGSPPFKGALKHAGWRVREVRMPSVSDALDPAILAPAEVELP